MRILYLIHSTIEGGATMSFLTLIKGMVALNITPYIIIPKKERISSLFLDEINRLGINYYKVYLCQSVLVSPKKLQDYPKYWLKKYTMPIRQWYSQKHLIFLIKKIKPDIIHTNTGILHDGFEASKKLNIPHIWHLREYQDLDFKLNIYPSFNSFCQKLKHSYVIAITKGIMTHFNLQNYNKAYTIYNGVFSQKDNYYNPNKSNYFLCASRISPEKGIDQVIKAFSILKQNENHYKLLIAGSGDDKYINELKLLTQQLKCEKDIIFLGFIKDIKSYMLKAKALIVASHNEGFGRMTAEACFCGCIVIGRNTAGTQEILNETGGFLFNNINELSNAMNTVIHLPIKEYEFIAHLAQDKAIKLYSIENYIDQVHNIYKQIKNRS